MKKTLLILIIITGLIAFSNNKLEAQATADELMDGFFTIFDEDVNQAIDYLFATNPLIDNKQAGIKAIKERLELSRKLLGNFYGWEIVSIYH
ncbi:MAG: hypothetical protein PHE33_11590, partial [Bacteroidales bacterium]|nr:hypothetical protein [Bacteroidales bacterium]